MDRVLQDNIKVLSHFNSLAEARSGCIANGDRLIEKASSCSAKVDAVFETIRVALSNFSNFLANPTVPERGSTKWLSEFVFFSDVRTQLRKVYQLFTRKAAPCFRQAMLVTASQLVSQSSLCPIPWEIFSAIMHQKELNGMERKELERWIQSVNYEPRVFKPTLLFYLFADAARRFFPQGTDPRELKYRTFLLAWRLYGAGLLRVRDQEFEGSELTRVSFDAADEPVPFQVGRPLPLSFPVDNPLFAYEVAGQPPHNAPSNKEMVLVSTHPLLLGLLQCKIRESDSCIPYLETRYIDPLGRFIVVDRLIGSLRKLVWNGQDGFKVDQLISACSDAVKAILLLEMTPELDPSRMFLNQKGEVCLLEPLRKGRDFFCLRDIELFIRKIAQKDSGRIRAIMAASGFNEHSVVVRYKKFLEKQSLLISRQDVRSGLEAAGLRNDVSEEDVWSWVTSIQGVANSVKHLLSANPPFMDMDPNKRDTLIVKAILDLQKEIGFCSLLPDDLRDSIVGRLSC